ncbi:MAG: ABC transporter substrate-binding protein [Fusobacteriaceae bacterium]|jgi:branched-chain amino acid transport system substrate-binding protein|nr:ABC transporter substrate-binding protein [Fusobacteriaceae bacterium]
MKKLFLLLATLITGLFATMALAADEIYLGVTSPATGYIALYGQSINQGVQLAIDEINAAGGVLGKKIKVDFLDDKGDATEGANTYNILKGRGVSAIIGSCTSGVTAGIAAKADADKMIVITPTGTADMLTVGKNYIYRACFIDSRQGKYAATYAKDILKVKTAGLLYCGADEYSLGLAESFRKEAEALGIKIVASETSATMDDVEFSAQLSKIAAANPDLLYTVYYYGQAVLIITQARQAGFEGPILGPDGFDGVAERINDDNKEAFHDVAFTNHYANDNPDPAVQKFVAAFTAKFGTANLNALSACAYDAAYILAQAIREAGSDETEKMNEAMKKMKFSGVTGTFTFENGNPTKGGVIIGVQDGVNKFIAAVE